MDVVTSYLWQDATGPRGPVWSATIVWRTGDMVLSLRTENYEAVREGVVEVPGCLSSWSGRGWSELLPDVPVRVPPTQEAGTRSSVLQAWGPELARLSVIAHRICREPEEETVRPPGPPEYQVGKLDTGPKTIVVPAECYGPVYRDRPCPACGQVVRREPDPDEARYAGQFEPCCDCGEDYPQADLKLRGEILCEKCRAKPDRLDRPARPSPQEGATRRPASRESTSSPPVVEDEE